MLRRKICPNCGAECQYDDRSVWEGNREHEEYNCPRCGYVLATAFTDQPPIVRIVTKDN